MVRIPGFDSMQTGLRKIWGGGDDGEPADTPAANTDSDSSKMVSKDGPDGDPIVSCTFQDGTLSVYAEQLFIDRPDASDFSKKWISLNQVSGVTVERRLVIHYIQIHQIDFDHNEGGILSTPVDENTLHFGGGKRDCATRAGDVILERAAVTTD